MADVTAAQFQQDVNNTADWANGDENTTVTMRLGQQADSPAKVIKDIKDAGSEAAGSIQFTVKGAFADGFTIDYYFELGETATGDIYRYKRPNALPFVVPAGFDPTVDSRFEQWVNTDHNNLTNRNAVGAHDDIYTRSFDSVADMIATSLPAGLKVNTKGYSSPNGVGDAEYNVFTLTEYRNLISSPSWVPDEQYFSFTLPNGNVAVLHSEYGVVNITQLGFVGESLFSDTQIYKGVSYPVERWTQNQNALNAIDAFLDLPSEQYHTLDIGALFIYLDIVSIKVWKGKRITGAGSKRCGFISGALNWADGTQSAKIDNVGFWGNIAYQPLPLPATNLLAEKDDPDKFYVFDDIDFGYGYGALGALTASSDGSSDDIEVCHCHFEMRDGVISGGSAPANEDRPKVTNIKFHNNTTKNIMFHGFAGIHFKQAKAYNNHFEEHYNGYASDISLGCVDCEFYNNTGKKLAAGVKAESRDFNGNKRNKFHDNDLEIDGSFGAAFNLMFRNSGEETELYNNTLRCVDYNPVTTGFVAFNNEGKSCTIKDNEIYITGSPTSDFKWLMDVKNKLTTGVNDQELFIKDNKIFNKSSLELLSCLQITSISADTFENIEVVGNEFYGNFASLVKPEFGTATAVVNQLSIIRNKFPNTELFRPSSEFSFVDVDIIDNRVTAKSFNAVVNMGFITVTGKFTVSENKIKSTHDGSGFCHLALASNSLGNLSAAKIDITDNSFKGASGALAYFLSGGVYLPISELVIRGNNITWSGSSTWSQFIAARGASVFAMNGNTIINQLDTTTGQILRPADSSFVKYEFNSILGNVTDVPG